MDNNIKNTKNTKKNVIDAYYNNGGYDISYILHPFKKYISRIFAISFFINLLNVAIPVLILLFLNNNFNLKFVNSAGVAILAIFLIIFANFILRYIRNDVVNFVIRSIDSVICDEVFKKIFKMPIKAMEKKGHTFWHLLFADIDTIRQGLSGAYIVNVFDIPFVILFMTFASFLLGKYFFILILILILYITLLIAAKYLVSREDEREKFSVAARNDLVVNTINDLSNFKTVNVSQKIMTMWNDYQHNVIENTYSRNYYLDLFIVLNFILYFIGVSIISFVGISLYKSGGLAIGNIIACVILFSKSFYLINNFVEYLPQYFNFMRSSERISILMAEQVENLKTLQITEIVNGNLTFDNVTLNDNRNNAILKDANFNFTDGMPYILNAKNSFEGSIILKALFGSNEVVSGNIKFDTYDIAEVKRDSIKDFIHYLPASSFVMDGTVKENLNFLLPQSMMDKKFNGFLDYKDASRILGFDEVVSKLPNGYNTIINSKTDLLTQEELKLLNLTRIMVGNPHVILLDRPFNDLSETYKDKLVLYLKKVAEYKIVIISTDTPVFDTQILVNVKNTEIKSETVNKKDEMINSSDGSETRAMFKRIFKPAG